jgi:hypothetical protein
VTDHDDVAAGDLMLLGLVVHLAHQGTGRIEGEDAPRRRFAKRRLGGAMRGKDQGTVRRAVGDVLDEHSPQGRQSFDDGAVVHDFVTDVDRRAIFGDRAFDHLDSAIHAGAEPARTGQSNLNTRARTSLHHNVLLQNQKRAARTAHEVSGPCGQDGAV